MKERFQIEPQEINFVQPLVIQAIGKPIPAVPAVTGVDKKPNNRKGVNPDAAAVEGFNIFNNKMASFGLLNASPLVPINNAVIPTSMSLSTSETGYSPVFSSPSVNTNSYDGQPPYAPPPIVFKGPHPSQQQNSYLSLSSNGNSFNSNSHPFAQQLAHLSSTPSHLFSTPLPSIIKANLLNTLHGVKNLNKHHHSKSDIDILAQTASSHVFLTPPPIHSPPGSIDAVFGNNVRPLPQIIKLNSKPTPRIQLIDLTSRPKKEALSSSFATHSKHFSEDGGEKVVKHIHVHKHIHQLDQDSSSSVFNSVRDNLDSFSTSLLSSTDPEFVSSNSLKRFLKSSPNSQRSFDAGAMLNLVKSNLRSCTCVPKHKCPASLIEEYNPNKKEDMSFIQNPRNKPNVAPVLSTSKQPNQEEMKTKTVPNKNETKTLKQIIKPRLKNEEAEKNETETQDRKIILNIKRIDKRDISEIKNQSNFNKVTPFIIENDLKENESLGITNQNLKKRDLTSILESLSLLKVRYIE